MSDGAQYGYNRNSWREHDLASNALIRVPRQERAHCLLRCIALGAVGSGAVARLHRDRRDYTHILGFERVNHLASALCLNTRGCAAVSVSGLRR